MRGTSPTSAWSSSTRGRPHSPGRNPRRRQHDPRTGASERLPWNGKTVALPASFAAALYHAAREQAVGHRVTVSFPDSVDELTPNQVAAELGISRPLLVKLLDDGTIPSRQLPGSRHRKVARVDLDAYQKKKSTRRRLIADAMNEVATAGE